MDRERQYEDLFLFLEDDLLLPDYLPDEWLVEHQAAARAQVTSARASAPPRRAGLAHRLSRLLSQRLLATRGQRMQAAIGIVLGYAGWTAMTGWWWTLAQARPEPVWWWLTGIGGALLAVATAAILTWLTLRLRARHDRRHVAQDKQAPVDAGSLT